MLLAKPIHTSLLRKHTFRSWFRFNETSDGFSHGRIFNVYRISDDQIYKTQLSALEI